MGKEILAGHLNVPEFDGEKVRGRELSATWVFFRKRDLKNGLPGGSTVLV